jgi:metal-responsive CopG/Arc/MetJ family transcriptional regulator
MAKAKKKSMKNQPEMYDELKKHCNLSLTQMAINGLDDMAKSHNLSRSEFMERFARGWLENKAEINTKKGVFTARTKKKSMRNEPEMYDEMKKRCNLSLTQLAINKLDEMVKLHGLSRSEFVERLARSWLEDKS